jgi:hypothetical protein
VEASREIVVGWIFTRDGKSEELFVTAVAAAACNCNFLCRAKRSPLVYSVARLDLTKLCWNRSCSNVLFRAVQFGEKVKQIQN